MSKKKDTVGIHFQMDKITSDTLQKEAEKTGRSKRQEAAIRLADHVARFSSVNDYEYIER
ncbi:TraY domain-containing protein [Aliivibrio sp. S4TY2]|uniref:TraY domain-containing protein n=1 Tax=unclassified Aliivibrio TaxID=2645654 RepID=UPI002377D3B8|nr:MULTISPECIES: TraY domain-containing protein [unclassified Aliivibrio]MDD9158094.1 TraY domain-containing protein [Aliivibrio sp. S4TY2]MDD9162009.1 TraY domain-containing protein [Aliivibrio sp. S4TY1]MDD9166091.1 TraY domain-containing protein [Aliivibrio sp. S4MY2]MDD9170089.1 TraY domain-containing protein [Aliivibrio sp. S4MY4]MDD9187105.1 TraY domain-containing protein [Aliivibrio sp. S4MY3]